MEKSSKRSKDDRRHHHHRESDRDDRRHRHRRHRSERESSSERKRRDYDREKSYDSREGSREREKSEESAERRYYSSKRKERWESHEEGGDGEKRARVSENHNGEVKRERRRFGDRRVKDEEGDDVDEVRVKREVDEKPAIDRGFEVKVKREVDEKPVIDRGFEGNGASLQPLSIATNNVHENSLSPMQPPLTKVSKISTSNENKGVNITGSHEVPGKSSTDGSSSSATKGGSLSLDALAKAKKALQMRKELAEKLKKIPALNKGLPSTLHGKEASTAQFSTAGMLQGPSASVASHSAVPGAGAAGSTTVSGVPELAGIANSASLEAVRRAQELAAKMGFRQDPQFGPLINLFPGQMPPEVTVAPKPTKAPVLRLDALGREIDEHGNVVNVTKPSSISTLKVNINKQKKDSFQILKPELEVDPEKNPHFDSKTDINKNKLLRPERMTFEIVEEGKWAKEA